MKAKITKKRILEFLNGHKHCSIATVTPEGMPEAATIYFGVDRKFNFFFPTGTLSRKFKNIQSNPRVALVVTDTERLITVQMEGVAKVIHEGEKSSTALQSLSKAMAPSLNETLKSLLDPVPPVIKMKNGRLAILQVEIEWVRWADFSLSAQETKGNFFVEVKI